MTQEVTKKGIVIFRVPLHLPDNRKITTVLRVTDETGWVFDQVCKSGNISLPESGEDFQITCDDLERRVFYFSVVHNIGADGVTYANVKFHTKTYALQQNPALASLTFPMAAPSITLRPVNPPPEPAPAAVAQPKTSPPSVSSSADTTDDDLEGLTPEEYASAVESAKRLKRSKQPASA